MAALHKGDSMMIRSKTLRELYPMFLAVLLLFLFASSLVGPELFSPTSINRSRRTLVTNEPQNSEAHHG